MTVAAKVVVYEAGAANPFPADAFTRGYSDITIHDLGKAPLDTNGTCPEIVIVNAGGQAPATLEARLRGPNQESDSPLILITEELIGEANSKPDEHGVADAFTQVLSNPLYESQLFSRRLPVSAQRHAGGDAPARIVCGGAWRDAAERGRRPAGHRLDAFPSPGRPERRSSRCRRACGFLDQLRVQRSCSAGSSRRRRLRPPGPRHR